MSEIKSDTQISALIVAGLLAALGTVAGNVVKGYWDTTLAQKDFQSKLILRALEPKDAKERISSLNFLVNADLISDPKMRNGLLKIVNEGPESVPQFLPVNAPSPRDTPGVRSDGSARESVVRKFPTLQGKNIALIGFRVRHGNIIDAVTPIYAEVTSSLELQGEFEGKRTGGLGGSETVLKQAGHVITGFDLWHGEYFGESEVVHIQIIWTRLTRHGLDPTSTVTSEKLGGDGYVALGYAALSAPTKSFRTNAQAFISDFVASRSSHTSGETFLNNIETSQTVIVRNDER